APWLAFVAKTGVQRPVLDLDSVLNCCCRKRRAACAYVLDDPGAVERAHRPGGVSGLRQSLDLRSCQAREIAGREAKQMIPEGIDGACRFRAVPMFGGLRARISR